MSLWGPENNPGWDASSMTVGMRQLAGWKCRDGHLWIEDVLTVRAALDAGA